jgi:hypothetical protein
VKILVLLIAATTWVAGCSTYAASRYSISADNVRTLRTFKRPISQRRSLQCSESRTNRINVSWRRANQDTGR